MKRLAFALALALALPAHADIQVALSGPSTVQVNEDFNVTLSVTQAGGMFNTYGGTVFWDPDAADFLSWDASGSILQGPNGWEVLTHSCNTDGRFGWAHTSYGTQYFYGPGELIKLKFSAEEPGTLVLDMTGSACSFSETNVRFYRAGIIVPCDQTGDLTITIEGSGGGGNPPGCSPDPCELDKPRVPSTWGTVKGIYR